MILSHDNPTLPINIKTLIVLFYVCNLCYTHKITQCVLFYAQYSFASK